MNIHILISRNKREGGYCGRLISDDRWNCERPSGHYRTGAQAQLQIFSLRNWSRQ